MENASPYAVGELVTLDRDGAEVWVAVVRATFTWAPDGTLSLVDPQPPLRTEDGWAGEPGLSGLVAENDLGPPKPRVDVLLEGKLVLPAPVQRTRIALQLGRRVKAASVTGDRYWLPGLVRTLALDEPRPFREMPFAWERACGGADPGAPRRVDRRNPVGRGMRAHDADLLRQRGPNFEDPDHPVTSWKDHPAPVGFGPVARHWMPRVSHAGTYDARWQDERFPLLPLDFDERFHNCAPEDQQLDAYVPGLELRLGGMTPDGAVPLRLPDLGASVSFVDPRGRATVVPARADTVILEPARARLSVVARAAHLPVPDVYAVRQVVVRAAEPPATRRRPAVPVGEVTT